MSDSKDSAAAAARGPFSIPYLSPGRWRRTGLLSGLCALCIAPMVHAAQPPLLRDRIANDRPMLVIVGTSHFDNPGLDINNVKVDDVLAPPRQEQIRTLVDRLAAFKPTHVAVEWPQSKQAALDQRYHDYLQGRYTLSRNEVDQLGLRLAAMLKLPRVDAADWNEEPPGKDQDYDFEAWARAHGQEAWLKAVESPQDADADTALLARSTLLQYLCALNSPDRLAADNRLYFDYAMIGNEVDRPGANWVGSWYSRNLKILANLVHIAPGPGDRVVAVFGAGHAFLLQQFAGQSGAFTAESPRTVLGCQ